MGLSAQSLGAKLKKVRAMSARELTRRVRYKAFLALERRRHAGGTIAPPDRLQKALRKDLRGADWRARLLAARRATTARFFPSVHQRDGMRALFETSYIGERAATFEQADLACSHRFSFFGHEFTYGDSIAWQDDPVTGRPWPRRYHADVPVHGGDVGFGDVKHVWELSRQQYLIDLGKAHALSGEARYLHAIQRLVGGWIAGNPYGTGVNWSCALEPAFRAWSWLWAYHLTVDALPDEFHEEWLRSFYDHARFLADHLEHDSSPFNHLIGEACTLYTLGHAFPEFSEAAAWRDAGRAVLEERLSEQFYADGGSVEQSTFYHHATTGFYLLAALVGRANGDALSAGIWAAIERGLEFSMRLAQPDGRTPEIGGADDGKPIRMEHLPFWDFRPYQAIGAVLFARPDFKAVSGRFYEDALWLLGPDGRAAYAALNEAAPTETAVVLPHSGYAVARSGWSTQADYLCVDVGEQAAGMRTDGIPNSMHGHADCLSMVLSLDGRRVLVDSGLYAYNCGGAWESHFRETAAHSTARIDGRDQAKHIGKMAWSHSYRPTIEGQRSDGRQSWVIASHDGYARGPEGVTHRRAVWLRAGGYVLVWDEFTGQGQHDIEVNYQFAPGLLAMGEPAGHASFDDRVDVAWASRATWAAGTRCGGEAPQDGWICPSLGVRQAAPRLTLTTRSTAARTTLLTVLARRAQAGPRVALVANGGGTWCAVADGPHVDWVAASGVADGSVVDGPGPLTICRVDGNGEIDDVAFAGDAAPHIDRDALQRLHRSAARMSDG